jgi:hypothetical protein
MDRTGPLTARRLRTPRAAAIAGILFSGLLIAAMLALRPASTGKQPYLRHGNEARQASYGLDQNGFSTARKTMAIISTVGTSFHQR